MDRFPVRELEHYTGLWERTLYPDLVNTFGYCQAFEHPKIRFSPRIKTESRGVLGNGEIARELRKVLDDYNEEHPHHESDFEPHWVRGLTSLESSKPYLQESENLQDKFSPNLRRLRERVREIWYMEKVEFKIYGEYDRDYNIITLYYNVYDDSNPEEYFCYLRLAFAHLYLNAYHYFSAPDTYCDDSYYSVIVREALADFYAYKFGLDNTCAVSDAVEPSISAEAAHQLEREWYQFRYNDLPRTYARFFMYSNGRQNNCWSLADIDAVGALEKLIYIFDISRYDMYRAYIELVPEDERRFLNAVQKSVSETTGSAVCDCGYNESDRFFWGILKDIVTQNGLSSIEEIAAFIPKGIFEITRGRFITLESGEIVGAYPQFKIKDINGFLKFAHEHCHSGITGKCPFP